MDLLRSGGRWRGGRSVLLVRAVSQVSLIQNNQYEQVALFRVTDSEPQQGLEVSQMKHIKRTNPPPGGLPPFLPLPSPPAVQFTQWSDQNACFLASSAYPPAINSWTSKTIRTPHAALAQGRGMPPLRGQPGSEGWSSPAVLLSPAGAQRGEERHTVKGGRTERRMENVTSEQTGNSENLGHATKDTRGGNVFELQPQRGFRKARIHKSSQEQRHVRNEPRENT